MHVKYLSFHEQTKKYNMLLQGIQNYKSNYLIKFSNKQIFNKFTISKKYLNSLEYQAKPLFRPVTSNMNSNFQFIYNGRNLYKFNLRKYNTENNSELHNYKKHFIILGIDKNFSKEEVKNSFLKLTKIYHPDINKNDYAEKNFQEIKNSYEILIKYFDTQEEKNKRFEMQNKEIDNLISIILNAKTDNVTSENNNIKEKKEENIKKSYEDEKILQQKIKMLQTISSSLNNNQNSIDYLDLKKIKKVYKKRIQKLEQIEKAKLVLEKAQKEKYKRYLNKFDISNHFFEQNHSSTLEGNKDVQINFEKSKFKDFLFKSKYLSKFKSISNRIYEITIKLIVVYCLCSFIAYSYSKKAAFFIGFYLIFMIITN